MPIIATTPESKEFKLASEGVVQAVLNKVEDKGLVDTVFNGVAKKTHKVVFWWQLAEKDEDGKTPIFLPERFTLSLHEKAALFKRIKGLFGKNPPPTLDLEKLVGTNTNLVIVHNDGKDKQGNPKKFANVSATTKLTAGQAKLEIVAMPERKKDAVQQAAAPAQTKQSLAVTPENPITDDDIPF
jgi:hypothetical protein